MLLIAFTSDFKLSLNVFGYQCPMVGGQISIDKGSFQ